MVKPLASTVENTDFKDKNVLVLGLGLFGGGVGVTRFLAGRGANITVTDLNDAQTLAASIEQLNDLPITYHLGGHQEEDITGADLIVVNPAIPKNSSWLQLACDHKIAQTSEMNLFFQHCPAPIIGVTGSNGKSTTTAMIAHLLNNTPQKKFVRTWLGGNIGQQNLLQQVDQIQFSDIVVLELSSFQLYDLADIARSPHLAVVTNITPNHLDWHGDMAAYIHAKQNILRFQSQNDHAILNRLDKTFQDWPVLTPAKVHWYPDHDDNDIELKLPGRHNRQNAAAALTVARLLAIDLQTARDSLKNFAGLEHRLEWVRTIDGAAYHNDSISTTPESTIAAIDAFDETKILILGGYDKKIPFDQLIDVLIQPQANVESVILLGQVRDKLASQITQAKEKHPSNHPHIELADDLDNAVRLAHNRAQSGMVVLLSPACASYDMFQNFQHRGHRFKELVAKLT